MERVYRAAALAVAERPAVQGWVRHGRLGRDLVERFIAGETLNEALAAARNLNARGLTTTLDQLGESVEDEWTVRIAADTAITTLQEMAADGLEPNISIKLTMFGLDLDERRAVDRVAAVLAAAERVHGFVRIDMESAAYIDRTLAITEQLHERFPGRVGTVIQSYMRRSPADVDRLIARAIRVRLVKGAYAEPRRIAFRRRQEIDAAYRTLAERLLRDGRYPALATHDPALIEAAQAYAAATGIASDRYEFQMLYGVQPKEQVRLRREGYQMRIYVPFGTEWYAYFSRRIAERPANALFVARQLVEGRPGRGRKAAATS